MRKQLKMLEDYAGMTPEVISAYAAVATLVVSIIISIILQCWSNRVAKAEHERSIREWWNALNVTALSNDEILLVADELMTPSAVTQSIKEKRRRWFAFLVLNALSSSFLGARAGLTRSEDDTMSIVRHHLEILLFNDDIYQMSQEGYEKDFAELCRKVRAELSIKQPQSASPPSTKTV